MGGTPPYIDDMGNVYDTAAIERGESNPRRIARYESEVSPVDGEVRYSIPAFNLVGG